MDNETSDARRDEYAARSPPPAPRDAPGADVEINGRARRDSRGERDGSRDRSRDRYASRDRDARDGRDDRDDRDRVPPPRTSFGRDDGARDGGYGGYGRDRDRDYGPPRRAPPPPAGSQVKAEPNKVLGVFGLSIRTRERDLEDEFMRYGDVEKVVIVYDQRTDRSRGFGFITMRSIEDATRCIEKLNGLNLHGRNIRVDYSATQKPHNPTPGEYMGVRRDFDQGPRGGGGGYGGGHGGGYGGGGRYDDRRGGYDRRDRDYPPSRRDEDPYGGRSRRDDYERRRSPSPRRSRYSASPDRRAPLPSRDYDDAPVPAPPAEESRY